MLVETLIVAGAMFSSLSHSDLIIYPALLVTLVSVNHGLFLFAKKRYVFPRYYAIYLIASLVVAVIPIAVPALLILGGESAFQTALLVTFVYSNIICFKNRRVFPRYYAICVIAGLFVTVIVITADSVGVVDLGDLFRQTALLVTLVYFNIVFFKKQSVFARYYAIYLVASLLITVIAMAADIADVAFLRVPAAFQIDSLAALFLVPYLLRSRRVMTTFGGPALPPRPAYWIVRFCIFCTVALAIGIGVEIWRINVRDRAAALRSDFQFNVDANSSAQGATRLVMDNIRVDDLIVHGNDQGNVRVTGSKTVGASNQGDADRADRGSEVHLTRQGDAIVLGMDQVAHNVRLTNLEVVVPKGLDVEVKSLYRGFDLGVATLERRSRRRDIGVSDPHRCGIASTDRSRRRDRQL